MKSALLLLAACGLILAGCGATQRESAAQSLHAGLDVVTDTVDPSYSLAIATCDARAQAIVDRQGTTEDEDRAAMAQVRERCDAVFEGFEDVRRAQSVARAVAESYAAGEVDLSAALGALGDVRALWDSLASAIAALKAGH